MKQVAINLLLKRMLFLTLLAVAFYTCDNKTNIEKRPDEGNKHKVAILPFQNLGVRTNISKLNEFIRNKIIITIDCYIIDETDVLKTLQGFKNKNTRDLGVVQNTGRAVKANYVISGSYRVVSETIEIHGFIVEVSSGALIGSVNEKGKNLPGVLGAFLNDLVGKLANIPSITRIENKGEKEAFSEIEIEGLGTKQVQDTEAPDSTRPAAIPEFETETDFGWLSVFAKPMYRIIIRINGYFDDLGFSTIVFAMLLNFLFFIFYFNSRKKLREIQSQSLSIRRLYADNQELMHQELQAMYRRVGLNPAMGCIFFVFQVILLIALYYVFSRPEEFTNVSTFLWITDLSSRDPYYILPIMGGVVFFTHFLVQRQMNVQAQVTGLGGVIFLAIISTIVFFFLPSGMILVFMTFNFLNGLQNALERSLLKMTFVRSATLQIATLMAFIIVGMIFFSPKKSLLSSDEMIAEKSVKLPVDSEKTPSENRIIQQINALLIEKKWEEAIAAIDFNIRNKPRENRFKELKVEALYGWSVDLLMKGGERYGVFSNLTQALEILPNHENSQIQLANIYTETGKEEFYNICIRKGPSEFYSLLRLAKKNEILQLHPDENLEDDWLSVDDEDNMTGWIYKPLVEKLGAGNGLNEARVTGKRAKSEVYAYLDKALELNPSLKRTVFWIKYKNIIIPSTIVLIFVIGIVFIIRQMY